MKLRLELQAFAERMEKKLRQNDHKRHWRECSLKYLMNRIDQEYGEFLEARREGMPAEEQADELADVANFAMMIADKILQPCEQSERTCQTQEEHKAEACKCSLWCRAEPQPITDKHHKYCPKYDEKIRVVKITHEGQSYYDADIANALQSLADGDDYAYQVEIMQMLKREYEALPEFEGF